MLFIPVVRRCAELLVLWQLCGYGQGMAAVEDHLRLDGLFFAELFSSALQLRAATHTHTDLATG